MSQRSRRTFTPEQKADAVRLVQQVGNLTQVARDLGLNRHVLKRWVRQARGDEPRKPAGKPSAAEPQGKLTADERRELTRLRREVRTLTMEREFLKKAAAFFAKDRDRPAS